jgi:hypothetical protein
VAALEKLADTLRLTGDSISRQEALLQKTRAAGLARSLRGIEALYKGDRAVALSHLTGAAEQLRPVDTWVTVIDYLLGREYLAGGDLERAQRHMLTPQRWAAGGETDLILPREFYLGQIAEARGNRAAAREHYARFVRWWRDCDPELRAWWEEGRRGLARVTGEAGVPPNTAR